MLALTADSMYDSIGLEGSADGLTVLVLVAMLELLGMSESEDE